MGKALEPFSLAPDNKFHRNLLQAQVIHYECVINPVTGLLAVAVNFIGIRPAS